MSQIPSSPAEPDKCSCFVCNALNTAPQLPPGDKSSNSELPANLELSKWIRNYRYWHSSLSSASLAEPMEEWKTQDQEQRERLLGIGKPREEGHLRSEWDKVKAGLMSKIKQREMEEEEDSQWILLERSDEFEGLEEGGDDDKDQFNVPGTGSEGVTPSPSRPRRSNTRSSIPVRKRIEEKELMRSKKARRYSMIPIMKKYQL